MSDDTRSELAKKEAARVARFTEVATPEQREIAVRCFVGHRFRQPSVVMDEQGRNTQERWLEEMNQVQPDVVVEGE